MSRTDVERVRKLVIETVSMLCKNGLTFNERIDIQGVIGVSIDDKELFLIHIDEVNTPDDIKIKQEASHVTSCTPYVNNQIKLEHNQSSSNIRQTFPNNMQYSASNSNMENTLKFELKQEPQVRTPIKLETNQDASQWAVALPMRMTSPRTPQRHPMSPGQRQSMANPRIRNPQINPMKHMSPMHMQSAPHMAPTASPRGRGGLRGTPRMPRGSTVRAPRMQAPSSMNDDDMFATETVTSYVCKICDAKYPLKSSLVNHQVSAHGKQRIRTKKKKVPTATLR